MKCPNCDKDLVQTKRDNIEVEYCPSCHGMWLSRQELEGLEDEAFDFGDDEKGTLIFSATATSRKCPQCSKPMKRFKYRLYDLEMDFCEDGHGFWLDADEDKRILALMKEEEVNLVVDITTEITIREAIRTLEMTEKVRGRIMMRRKNILKSQWLSSETG